MILSYDSLYTNMSRRTSNAITNELTDDGRRQVTHPVKSSLQQRQHRRRVVVLQLRPTAVK